MALLDLLYDNPHVVVGSLIVLASLRLLWTYQRLSKFKGPLLSGFSELWHSTAMISGNCHEWYTAVNEKYGPLARVAPNVLITDSPTVWMHINREPQYKRTDWYYQALRIEHRRDNVFSETDNAKHDKRRLQMMPGYSGRENLALEGAIDQVVHSLLALINTKYVSTPTQRAIPMDLAQKMQFFTLDVISSVGLGQTFGMLTSDSDVEHYLESSEQGIRVNRIFMCLGLSGLSQMPLLGKYLLPKAGDSSGFGKMMEACFNYIDERLANPHDKRHDMLESFMRHGLTGADLRSEAAEQILAGSDTTAGAIRGTLLHIISNPRVYAKLQKEVDEAIRDGRAPSDNALISFTQTKKLPYLQAVIREGMRIWIPVAALLAKDVPPQGDTIDVDGTPVFVPGGTSIGFSGHSMHRRRDIYGEDSHVFRPERWFEEDAAKLEKMVETIELTFGYGKWKCLGKPVAQIEIGKVIFELLRNFDITLINPLKPWKSDYVNGLWVLSDMWVQVIARDT